MSEHCKEEFWNARLKSGASRYFTLRLYWGDDIEARLLNEALQINRQTCPAEIVWFDIFEGRNPAVDYGETDDYIRNVVGSFLNKNLDPKNHILLFFPDNRNNQQHILHYLFSNKWFTYLSERSTEHQWRCGSKSCELLHQGSMIKLYLDYIYSSANLSSNLVETFF